MGIERPTHSLLKQVHLHYLPGIQAPPADSGHGSWNARLNADGWGIGWYSPSQTKYRTADTLDAHTGRVHRVKLPPHMPTVLRSVIPPLHDLNLRSVAQTTESEVVFGHIRAAPSAASLMLKTRSEPSCPGGAAQHCWNDRYRDSCRPLFHPRRAPRSVANLPPPLLLPLRRPLDRPHPDQHCTPPSGSWLDLNTGQSTSWISLNLAITDGDKFVALRFAYPQEREAPSLYWSRTAGSAFNRLYRTHPDGGRDVGKIPREDHAPHFIVASEPMTMQHHEWTLMKNGDDSEDSERGGVSLHGSWTAPEFRQSHAWGR
ncbi:hypothetical protein JCM11251_006617 [Rhodosporidiobolus azoricus]